MMLLTTVTRSIGTWYPVLVLVYHIHRKDGRTQGHTPGTRYTYIHVLLHTCHVLHVLIYNINKPGPSNSFTYLLLMIFPVPSVFTVFGDQPPLPPLPSFSTGCFSCNTIPWWSNTNNSRPHWFNLNMVSLFIWKLPYWIIWNLYCALGSNRNSKDVGLWPLREIKSWLAPPHTGSLFHTWKQELASSLLMYKWKSFQHRRFQIKTARA